MLTSTGTAGGTARPIKGGGELYIGPCLCSDERASCGVPPIETRARSREIWHYCWHNCHRTFVRWTNKIIGDGAEAEDIVASVYMKAWVTTVSEDSGGTCCHARFHNFIRCSVRRGVQRHLECNSRYLLLRNMSKFSKVAVPEFLLQENETLLLQKAISGLCVKHRILVIFRYFYGLPYSEMATLLRISTGAVKLQLNRACCRLHDVLCSDFRGFSGRLLQWTRCGYRRCAACRHCCIRHSECHDCLGR